MDKAIAVLREAIEKARLGREERLKALKRLRGLVSAARGE